MPVDVPAAAKSATLPASVLTAVKAFGLAHPIAVLGLVGGALVLLGGYDAVRAHREKSKAPAGPAASPGQAHSEW